MAGIAGMNVRMLPLKTFEHKPVVGIYASQYRRLSALANTLKRCGIKLYEADIRPPERYLMERFICASVQFEGGVQEGHLVIDCKLKPSEYRPTLRMVSLDIETSAHEELYSVALVGCGNRQVYMLGTDQVGDETGDFDLEYCTTSQQLIEKLNAWFSVHDPDAIVGGA